MAYTSKCPSCDETLNIQARQCACGWKNPKYFRADGEKEKVSGFDPRCTFQTGGLRCSHPVGAYDARAEPGGHLSGWCIFHRRVDPADKPQLAADITRDSAKFNAVTYLLAAQKQTYGVGDSHEVARIRAGLSDPRTWPDASLGALKVSA